jgi:serine/threonine protein kinase/Leucine-rich repeat (LRR) protein
MSSVPRPDDQRPSAHDETLVDSDGGSARGSAGFSLHPSVIAAGQPPKTVEEFSHNLTASGLMSADELKSFCETHPRDAVKDAAAFAELLIATNRLTPYQAETLRQGHTRGLVLGNYVILEKLGEGGMGMVFKARHRLMKRIAALKVLPPSLTQSEDAVTRFHREVEVAAKLAHPNIAAAHDADQADGIHFLVMEYVDGPNLSALVKELGPLAPPVAMNIISQAAAGLAHAHAHGIVHRDIKPGNLLVGRDGVVKVLDMGLAQFTSAEQNSPAKADLTQSGRIMGTVDYMAPEQALDAKTVDQRADIYSLGCTLFYLLSGRSLSPDGTLTQKLLWHQTETVPALATVSPTASAELEAIYQKMVAKKPDDRFANMDEVVAALAPLLAECTPEQLQIPVLEDAISSDGDGPITHVSGPERTRADRPTPTVAGIDDDDAPKRRSVTTAPPLPPARAKRQRVWPIALALGVAGVAAGIGLFVFLGKQNANRPKLAIVAGEEARLVVTTSQPLARVFVDGKELGQTSDAAPHRLELTVPAGEHQLRVDKEGYKSFTAPVTLKVEKPLELAAPLGTLPATVDVVVDLTDVMVSVDGRAVGTPSGKGPYHLPLVLDPGEHLVRYEAQGYEAKEEKLTIKSGEKFERRVTLISRPYRELLTLIFKSPRPDVAAPVMLVDEAGHTHTPRRWADVPTTYREVRAIDLSHTIVRKEELPLLAKLPTLESLSLANTAIDDDGLRELEGVKSLTRLDLANTPVTDKGVARLARLDQLRELDLSGTKITDAGLESLTALPLEVLLLASTDVSDQGVQALATINTLKTVAIDGTRATEESFHAFAKVFTKNPIDKNDLDPELSLARKLLRGGASIAVVPEVASSAPAKSIDDAENLPSEKFRIAGITARGSRSINDALMPEIKQLTRLESIDLEGSAVTDDGLAQLRQVATLDTIELGYLRVAKASVDSLRQTFPTAKINWQGPRDRIAAEWVIGLGGTVRINALGGRSISKVADLPENRDFRLEEIHLTNEGPVEDSDFGAIKDLGDLKLLNLLGTEVSETALAKMTGCERLQSLAVSGPTITPAALKAITERFPNLERLYVGDSAITGDALSHLTKLSKLKKLSLTGAKLADGDLAPLTTLPELAWLSLAGVPVTDDAIPTLARLKKLKVLSLDDDRLAAADQMMDEVALPAAEGDALRITDAGLEELKMALKTTTFVARPLDAQRLAARWVLQQGGFAVAAVDGKEVKIDKPGALPSNACQLLEVTLRNAVKLSPEAMASHLRDSSQLRLLDLSGNAAINDKAISALGELPALESLNLAKTGVTDESFATLAKFPRLRVLGLQSAPVSGSGLVKHPLPKLTHVYLGTTDVTDATLKALRDSSDLIVLDMSNCRLITDLGVTQLSTLSKLEQLDLSLTRITDASASTVGKLKRLRHLNLSRTSVTDAFTGPLTALDQLEVINLAGTKITDAGLTQLGSIASLRKIFIRGTSVTEAAAQPIRNRKIEVDKSDDPPPRDANVSGGFGF